MLGVCRASQKGKSDRDVKYALNDFEAAFYKDNLGQISLDALCSHITLCAEMGRKENDLVNNFLISENIKQKFYNEEFERMPNENGAFSVNKYILDSSEYEEVRNKIMSCVNAYAHSFLKVSDSVKFYLQNSLSSLIAAPSIFEYVKASLSIFKTSSEFLL